MNTYKSLVALATCCLLTTTVSPTLAETVTINPAKDNTLYQDANGTLSNGAGVGLFSGRTGTSGPGIVRSLLKFDIGAEVPATATIDSVTLTLNVSQTATAVSDLFELRRVEADWGEADSMADRGGGVGGPAQPGDATWIHSFTPGTTWTNAGGDFSDVVSATQSVQGLGDFSWSDPQLVADVQDMLDTPHTNFGWILRGNEQFDTTARRFGSRESNNMPALVIEYSPGDGLRADFDEDDDVDGDDLGDWQSAFGSTSGGDADGDTDSDGADFVIWQREFTGPAQLQSLSGTTVVPEPTTVLLAALAWMATALRSRRSGHRSGRCA